MRRGDIYLVSLDPVEGREHQGMRHVLIVSPTEFNPYPAVELLKTPRTID